MFSSNHKVSLRQLQVLLVLYVFGTGVITLPKVAAIFANQDGWIAVLVSTALAAVSAYLITAVVTKFCGDSFMNYCAKALTKPLGFLVGLLFLGKLVVSVSLELSLFSEIINETMLDKTPPFITSAALLIVCAYTAQKGYETRARIAEVLILILFIPFLLVFLMSLIKLDYTNLMPVLSTPPKKILLGGANLVVAFSGLELFLFAGPFIRKNRVDSFRGEAFKVVIFIGGLLTLITAVAIAKFGPLDIKWQKWPVLKMMDLIEFALIDRQTALIISFWIGSVFAIINASLFFSGLLLKDIIKKGSMKLYIWLLVPVILVLSVIIESAGPFYFIFDYFFMFVLPLAILFISTIRGLGGCK